MIGKQILEEERGHRKLERTTKGGGGGGEINMKKSYSLVVKSLTSTSCMMIYVKKLLMITNYFEFNILILT